MKFLVPNYSCLQNPWLGGCRPQIPVLSVLNWICWTPPPPQKKKIPGYATAPRWVFMLIAVAVRRPAAVWNVTYSLLQKVGPCWEKYIECIFRVETAVYRTNYSSIPGRGSRFSSSLKRPDRLWGTPSLVFNGYRNSTLELKRPRGGVKLTTSASSAVITRTGTDLLHNLNTAIQQEYRSQRFQP